MGNKIIKKAKRMRTLPTNASSIKLIVSSGSQKMFRAVVCFPSNVVR